MKDKQAPTNISDTQVPNYDIWQMAIKLIDAITVPIQPPWIKAHQDETSDGMKLFGPWKVDVQLNIEVDKLAKQGALMNMEGVITRPLYSTMKVGFYDVQGHQIGDLREYIRDQVNGEPLQEYQRNKFDWQEETRKLVCWQDLGKTLEKYKPVKRTRVTQLMYDWQYVGRWREMIIGTCGKCKGCGREETKLHYLTCSSQHMVNGRKKA